MSFIGTNGNRIIFRIISIIIRYRPKLRSTVTFSGFAKAHTLRRAGTCNSRRKTKKTFSLSSTAFHPRALLSLFVHKSFSFTAFHSRSLPSFSHFPHHLLSHTTENFPFFSLSLPPTEGAKKFITENENKKIFSRCARGSYFRFQFAFRR